MLKYRSKQTIMNMLKFWLKKKLKLNKCIVTFTLVGRCKDYKHFKNERVDPGGRTVTL